jgi:hypothetical protein
VADGGDEGFLNDVEARLLIMNQLKNIDIHWQLIALEKAIPSRLFAGPGPRHGQLFVFSHYQHLQPVE